MPESRDPYAFPGLLWHVFWPVLLPIQVIGFHSLTGFGGARARRLEAILQLEIWGAAAVVGLGLCFLTALAIRFRRRLGGSASSKVTGQVLSSALLTLAYLLSRYVVEVTALVAGAVFFLGAGRIEPGPAPLVMPCAMGLLTGASIELTAWRVRRRDAGIGA